MIPEIDIWRVANLMLKRYGDEADIESAIRAEELAEEGDHNGVAVWRRVIEAESANYQLRSRQAAMFVSQKRARLIRPVNENSIHEMFMTILEADRK